MFIAPQIALAAWTWQHWGNVAGPLTMMDEPVFSLEAFKSGSLGLLIDRENGLLVWAPIYALVPSAWALSGRRCVVWLLPVAVLLLMSAAHLHWWGGFSPAARFLVPLVPIFASAGAAASSNRLFRYICIALLIPQLFVSADGWQHARRLWPQGDGHNPVLAGLLGWVGGSESTFPSLRNSAALTRAVVIMAIVAMANVLVVAASRMKSRT
jgi:hypothetical protein